MMIFHAIKNPFLTVEHIERWSKHPSILIDYVKNKFMYDDVVYKTYALKETRQILRKIFLNILDNDTVNSILKYVTFDWIEL